MKRKLKKEMNLHPEDKKYSSAIIAYLLIFFVLNTVLLLAFVQLPNVLKTYTPEESLLETLIEDNSGLALMDETTYLLYKDDYESYLDNNYCWDS